MKALFSSRIDNKIDRKGRVSVPAAYRAALTKMDDQAFYAFPSFQHRCLECLPNWKMDELAAKIAGLDMFSPEQDNLNTLIFAAAQALSWDNEGRIGLTGNFIKHAEIEDQISFVGKGYSFQIWSPAKLDEYLAALQKQNSVTPPHIPLKNRGPQS